MVAPGGHIRGDTRIHGEAGQGDELDSLPTPTDVSRQRRRPNIHAWTSSPNSQLHPQVTVTAVEDHPVAALLHAAKAADLFVAGSRWHRLHADTLLGSVSERCVLDAPCSNVVVRSNPAYEVHDRERAHGSGP